MSGVAQWLASLGLEKYAGAFSEAEIDLETLRELTAADLEELGIPLGPRKKLLKAIGALRGITSGNTVQPASASSESRHTTHSEAERRQLTVLFADMVGSTALSQGMDPEELREIIRDFQDSAAGAIARFDGYVAKFMGDGLLAYFGWPRAHEDDAERAVRAGLGLVEAMRLLKRPQEVRVGIATGLVVVGDLVGSGGASEETAIGETLNLAARLQSEATPGSVVLAPDTRALLGKLFELESLGHRNLKGFSGPIEVCRVVGEAWSDSRFDAVRAHRLNRLIGRDQELALVLARWEQAKTGEGQTVLLRAEGGIGKSRIVAELRQRVDAAVLTSVSYQCSSHHVSSPLFPVVQHLERAARIATADTPNTRRQKLAEFLRSAKAAFSESSVRLLAALLSIPGDEPEPAPAMSPQEQKRETLGVLCDLLVGLTALGPLLVIVEDLHWSDPTTRELLDLLNGRVEKVPILILVTFRPEIEAPWQGRRHVTLLGLARLGHPEVEALISEVAGKRLPEAVTEQIVAKADGVPLFVEELTRTVVEGGQLKESGDRYEISGTLGPLAVPSSLQASLVSRLDRLAPVREIAQIGAALGRDFEFDLLASVAHHSREQLIIALNELHRAELVFPRGTAPRCTWVFKHALIQDAAYETMLKSARVKLHGRIADVLERDFPEFPERLPEVLAHHCAEAGLAAKAIEYYLTAAKRGTAASNNAEANAHLKKALRLVDLVPDSGRLAAKLRDRIVLSGWWWSP